jgi:predicted phage terminase large subunit-like protein
MVFMPPQHGKSTLIAEYFPAWYLGKFPDRRVIYASYEADFAATWGRKARNVMEEHGQRVFGINVSKDSSAANRWDIQGHTGGMNTAGVDGPITGKGAHLFVIDDPVKNADQADSLTYQEKAMDWYRSVARTRMRHGSAIILVMTRWNELDLAGRLLTAEKEGGENWTVLRLPALAEEHDPLGRALGDPLCPALFTREDLLATKAAVGSYWWQAMYQQQPTTRAGGLIKRSWWQYYKAIPEGFDEVIQSWDMSFKDTKSAKSGHPDFVVAQVWGKKDGCFFLLDQVRGQMDFVTTLQAVRNMTAKWPQANIKLIEDKANGPAVISALSQEIFGIIPVEPFGSKVARAQAVTPAIESGNVYLPDPQLAPWVQDFVEECAAFPTGRHDDQVDAMSQALQRLTKHGFVFV